MVEEGFYRIRDSRNIVYIEGEKAITPDGKTKKIRTGGYGADNNVHENELVRLTSEEINILREKANKLIIFINKYSPEKR